MTKYIEKIYDVTTGETTEREYTPDEIAEVQANMAQQLAKTQADAIKATEKAALLERLGITSDEAALLLS